MDTERTTISWEVTPETWSLLRVLLYARYVCLYGTALFFTIAIGGFLFGISLTVLPYVATVVSIAGAAAVGRRRLATASGYVRRLQLSIESSLVYLSGPTVFVLLTVGGTAVYTLTEIVSVPVIVVLTVAFGIKLTEIVVRLLVPERGTLTLPDEYQTSKQTITGRRTEVEVDLGTYTYVCSWSVIGLTVLQFRRTSSTNSSLLLLFVPSKTADTHLIHRFETDQ